MQAIDKSTGVLMEVLRSSKCEDADKEVYVSRQGIRYACDELTFPEQRIEPQRIYVVMSNGHEYDDIDFGESFPIFFSTDRDRARKFYDRLVQAKKQFAMEAAENHRHFYPNDTEPYYEEYDDNTDVQFAYILGKWCYTYRLEEHLMDSEKTKP